MPNYHAKPFPTARPVTNILKADDLFVGGDTNIMRLPPTPMPMPMAGVPVRAAAVGSQPEALPNVAGRSGDIIVYFSARGGVGTTTIAINTAAALANRGAEVCVVDLSLELGDVFVALGVDATTSIAAIARDADRLDGSTLRRRLARHESGIWLAGQDGNPDDIDHEMGRHISTFLELLTRHFDYVIVDGVRSFSECSLAALEAASRVELVLGQDVLSVRRAARAITLFRRLGYADSRLHLAMSRFSRKSLVSAGEVERALGLPVVAAFREDAKRVNIAAGAGTLLESIGSKRGLASDVFDHAASLETERKGTAERAHNTSEKSSLFARIVRRLRKDVK